MKLARYWTRDSADATGLDGGRIRIVARGWSNESLEGARQRARETAGKIAAALVSGQIDRQKQYLYGDRPLPEPITREFGSAGVVTRNSYGTLVLNTSNLMFVDIDRSDAAASPAELISSVLHFVGLKSSPATRPGDAMMQEISQVAKRNSLSVRVYKTAAGYRVIVTSRTIDAGSAQSQTLLQQFDADPLYVRLCRAQESFRARLTPKPWRCGAGLPPSTFPFTTAAEQSRYREWEAKYAAAASGYATCKLMGAASVETGTTAPELVDLIRYHDQETRSTSGLPLA
jgi:hypothetical protein